MAYPRFQLSRNFKAVSRATGTDISLTSTAVAELAAATNGPGAGGFDITLAAQVGDVLEWGFNGLYGNEAHTVTMDVYTIVSAAQVNPFGAGLSASIASTQGVTGWRADSGATIRLPLVGSMLYTVVSGDLASGFVTLRPYYAKANATARTLFSSANSPLRMWAKNLGPADPN